MICKGCYHSDMCGFEWCDDDALTFCKYFKDKSHIYGFSEVKEQW